MVTKIRGKCREKSGAFGSSGCIVMYFRRVRGVHGSIMYYS